MSLSVPSAVRSEAPSPPETLPDSPEAVALPAARGPLTAALFDALRGSAPVPPAGVLTPSPDPMADDDLQLALWVCYELHYRGLAGVAEDREWDPALIALRTDLEDIVLTQLRHELDPSPDDEPVADRLRELVDTDDGPSVARYVAREATAEQVRELMRHKSLYQLKEADPHTWAIPRLSGRAKAALVEIQTDEYGRGVAAHMHSELFRRTLRGLGLDDTYGAHLDAAPAVTLAITNVISLFGLHRSLRGALVGHLAAYEMTSSEPSRRIARGLRRLGADDDNCAFFDEHVTADSLHEQVAAHDLCGGLVEAEPALAGQVLFGAAVSLYVDRRFAEHLLGSWQAGRSSLRSAAA